MTQETRGTPWPVAADLPSAPTGPGFAQTSARPTSASPLRLLRPDSVFPAHVRWIYAVPILVLHVLALAVCIPWLFTWTGLIAFVASVPLFGQGINLCYHRLLTHHSFKVPKWFEHVLVLFSLCSFEDTPIRWVTTHRMHHNHSDQTEDPHSPMVAFLWAHLGWLLVINRDTNSLRAYRKFAPDLVADRFYRRLESRPALGLAIWAAHALALTAAGAGLGLLLSHGSPHQALRMGMSVLVWGVVLRTVAVWHITWSVNSVSHLFGYRTYDTPENSRNNWLIGLLGAGEGWHNNHHHDPASASVQHRWWELDPTYYTIKLLGLVGLATKIIPPRQERARRE